MRSHSREFLYSTPLTFTPTHRNRNVEAILLRERTGVKHKWSWWMNIPFSHYHYYCHRLLNLYSVYGWVELSLCDGNRSESKMSNLAGKKKVPSSRVKVSLDAKWELCRRGMGWAVPVHETGFTIHIWAYYVLECRQGIDEMVYGLWLLL